MTFQTKYRELNRLFNAYYDFMLSEGHKLNKTEKNGLIKEINAVRIRMQRIKKMQYQDTFKKCYHYTITAPSKMNNRHKISRKKIKV